MHNDHQHQNHQQIKGKQRHRNVVGDQPEQGRHQAVAHIGAGHLHADDGLRAFRAEVRRCGVDDAGIDGSAAQPHKDQARQRGIFPQGQQLAGFIGEGPLKVVQRPAFSTDSLYREQEGDC